MKASELRIGNLVSMPDKSVKEISAIDLFQFSEHFSPIPLTEEWLEKFGFEKKFMDNWYHYKLDYSYHTNDKSLSVGCDVENGYEIPIQINFVHQLQNLYFALTNSELQIKQTV